MYRKLKRHLSTATVALLVIAMCTGSMGLFSNPQVHATGTKLTITTSMITQIDGGGDPTKLVDEQSTAGDPANNNGGSPTTDWNPGFQSGATPANAYVDLGQDYDITAIYIYDGNGHGNFNVASGSPGNWSHEFTEPLTSYLTWKEHLVNFQTRYIRFTQTTGDAHAFEVVIYGSVSGGDTTAPSAITDLATDATTTSSIDLEWTAPGDDGTTGTATSYDIRYSTSTITSGNWASATQVSGEPTPASAGTPESMTVSGLSDDTTYYFAIKTSDEVPNVSALSNIASGTTDEIIGGTEAKIALDPSMVTNEIAYQDAGAMVDEQSIAGDPLNGTGGTPTNDWYLFGKRYAAPHDDETWWLPASAFIDLGAEYHITKIYFYDSNGSGNFTVSTGEPFDWDIQFVDGLTGSPSWDSYAINTDTRYIRFTLDSAGGHVNEMVVYGWPLESPESPPTPTPHVQPTMENFLGTNAFIDDPINKIEVVDVVREYHSWAWDDQVAYPNNENKWDPSYAGGGWDFDSYYSDLASNGITASPAVQGGVSWITPAYNTNMAVPSGLDSETPSSYAAHADHMFQYAARYGDTVVADGKLKLANDQTRSTGLGFLEYIENWNEPNADWASRNDYFSPYEFAAMTSADYDGHEGTMGNTFGVKNADSNMKLVMGGLAGFRLDYVKAMNTWAKFNRNDEKFPADVLNFHTYCQNATKTSGVSPEECELKDQARELTDYRDTYIPGVELWVTEFGYDTHANSPQRSPAIGSKSAYEVQGEWLVRSYLALAAGGIDRAFQFMLRDVDETKSGKYNTSGLVTKKGQWTPKPSWYYVYTLKNTLEGMRFLDEQSSGNGNVMIYKFKSATSDSGAYVVWAPTSNDTTVSNYQLSLQGSPSSATRVTMVDGDTDGVSSNLTISSNKVTFNVSEKPVFILVDDIE